MHVLIIGGGIGGLCLAQGLRRRGVSVAVYERDRTPDARLQGYRLSIEPPGSAALHDCLPSGLWQILVATSGDQGERMGVFDEQLRQLREAPPGADEMERARRNIRAALFAQLENVGGFGGKADQLDYYQMWAHDPGHFSVWLQQMLAATPQEVQKAAQEYLRDDRRAVITVLPEQKEAAR